MQDVDGDDGRSMVTFTMRNDGDDKKQSAKYGAVDIDDEDDNEGNGDADKCI